MKNLYWTPEKMTFTIPPVPAFPCRLMVYNDLCHCAGALESPTFPAAYCNHIHHLPMSLFEACTNIKLFLSWFFFCFGTGVIILKVIYINLYPNNIDLLPLLSNGMAWPIHWYCCYCCYRHHQSRSL